MFVVGVLLVGLMIGLGLFHLEIEFLWTMDRPSLVTRAKIVSLVVDFLGVFPRPWDIASSTLLLPSNTGTVCQFVSDYCP